MRFTALPFLFLAGSGCGGRSDAGDIQGRSGDTTDGSSTTGGASGCVEPTFPEYCLSTCFAEDPGSFFERVCVNDAWTCPAGTVSLRDCPPESCAGTLTYCCAENGRSAYRECDADGTRERCPPGSRPIAFGAQCAPRGIVVDDCLELDGAACDLAGSACHQGGTTCECPDVATRKSWQCLVLD